MDTNEPGSASTELSLWHVTVVVSGAAVPVEQLRTALDQLRRQHPFLASVRYAADRVEIRYWDEAEDIDDAAAMALRIWPENRDSAGLPDWRVVGLEVLDRGTLRERSERGLVPPALVLGEVRPL